VPFPRSLGQLFDINAIIQLNQPPYCDERYMANLIVRNVDDTIANALKVQASKHGISAEAEHRRILAQALLHPKKKPFLEALTQIPDVGTDTDFARVQDLLTTNPLD
jgi:antitoxin FitA